MSCDLCLEVIILNKPLRSLDHIHADSQLKQKTLINVLESKKTRSSPLKRKCALAALTLCILISFPFLYLFSSSSTPNADHSDNNVEAIISFDINPSIEFKVNKDLIVTSVKPYNQDAKNIVSPLNLKGKRIDTAIDILLQDTAYTTYFEDGILEIGIYTKNNKLSAQLDTLVQEELQNKLSTSQYHCSHIDEETHIAAHNSHTSIGKYRVIEEILSYDKTYSLEVLSSKSMKELYEILSLYDTQDIPESCQKANGENKHHGKHH